MYVLTEFLIAMTFVFVVVVIVVLVVVVVLVVFLVPKICQNFLQNWKIKLRLENTGSAVYSRPIETSKFHGMCAHWYNSF